MEGVLVETANLHSFLHEEIVQLSHELYPHVAPPTGIARALPVATQVLIALRFFVSGGFQSVVGDATSVHQSGVLRAIAGVTEALYRKALTEVKMPSGL